MNKFKKYKKDNKMTIHHNVEKSLGWSNKEINKTHITDLIHKAINILFPNLLPTQQIEKIVFGINPKVFTEEFKEKIAMILMYEDSDYYYNKWVFVKPKWIYLKHEYLDEE